MIYVGIDPGTKGCLAIVDSQGEWVAWHSTPTTRGKRGDDYLPADMTAIVREIKQWDQPTYCLIETASVRPLESNASSFKIGYGIGLWTGILATLGVPYSTVLPLVWKKHFSLVDGKLTDVEKKRIARAKAQALFPSLAGDLAKRRPDYAEALLLAEYARRTHKGSTARMHQ